MKRSFLLSVILFFITGIIDRATGQELDKPFRQAVSIKYTIPESLKDVMLKKVVADYNDVIYLLSDKGLYRISEQALVRDTRYTPLAEKIPVDICIQEGSGHLYYLYEDKALTNAYAGVHYNADTKYHYIHSLLK